MDLSGVDAGKAAAVFIAVDLESSVGFDRSFERIGAPTGRCRSAQLFPLFDQGHRKALPADSALKITFE